MKSSAIEESERETVIHLLGDKTSIFTGSLPVFNKLIRRGYKETTKADHYAWLEGPAKGISFRRVGKPTTESKRKPMSEEHKQRLRVALEHARKGG